jgi:phosphoglycerol transferase MdoB-like AlkP superfamily enzyme
LASLGRQAKVVVLVAAAFALFATTFSSKFLNIVSHVPFFYSFLFLVILICLFLPFRFFWLSVPTSGAILACLNMGNNFKIASLALPITYFDIEMVLGDPNTFVNALGLNDLVWLPYLGLIAIAAIVAPFAVWKVNNRVSFNFSRFVVHLLPAVSASLLVTIVAQQCLLRYAVYTRDSLPTSQPTLWQNLWLPSSQVTLSKEIGFPEYLAFSALAETESFNFQPSNEKGLPTPSEITEAAASFVNIEPKGFEVLPNVVIMHAESTFDPNRAFKLSSRVELPLWSGTGETKALGPLHVNIVGGGSWVTDFEVITGVDSRVFGFQGYYTTYYVAPMVKYSFAQYLSAKGYRTKVFSTVAGTTYNYEGAFKHYGFADYTDALALGMSSEWNKFRDRDFVTAIDRSGAFDASGPFLYFIDSTENHGPHPCKNFATASEFSVTYKDNSEFEVNCQLNEYLRRATSTSDAFLGILERLRNIQAATGRPYVLLAFGDHQPWDFTDGIYSVAGGTSNSAKEYGIKSLRAVRTEADVHETIFHIAASDSSVIKGQLAVTPPCTFLPSLLSAFVASSYDDLYFPENFYLMKMCGSDFAASNCAAYPQISAILKSAMSKSAIPSARPSLPLAPTPGMRQAGNNQAVSREAPSQQTGEWRH